MNFLSRFVRRIVCCLLLGGSALLAQEFKTLHSFPVGKDGVSSHAPLLRGLDGRLYGTTERGGFHDRGTIFAVNPDGSGYVVLRHFDDTTNNGNMPYGGLVQRADGWLFGTTTHALGGGGTGTIFALRPDGSEFRVLKNLGTGNDGDSPRGTLFLAPNGWLYGTNSGGGQTNRGNLFKLHPDIANSYQVLRQFDYAIEGTNWSWNVAHSLTEGSDGRLYGFTVSGGLLGWGTIYSLDLTTEAIAVLYNFDGVTARLPRGSLLKGSDGLLYGTTHFGGGSGFDGTVFRFDPATSSFSTLHVFDSFSAGMRPETSLAEGPDGRLYGTTSLGGGSGRGAIFSLEKNGDGFVTTSFTNDAYDCRAPLILGADGKLYGNTWAGGTNGGGTLFAITSGGSLTILRHLQSSSDAAYPETALLDGGDGRLYGTTVFGGATSTGYSGTVYSINPDGSGFTILRQFAHADGQILYAPVIKGTDGRLYGVTFTGGGGNFFWGTVFALNRDGTGFTVLHRFNFAQDGGSSRAALVQGSDGRLYGTTNVGGEGASSNGHGTVFAVHPTSGAFEVLHAFAGAADGRESYSSLVQGPDGRLFGTTHRGGQFDDGTLFAVHPITKAFEILHHFQSSAGGGRSRAGLIRASDGRLYGTTSTGGAAGGGTVFSIVPSGPPDFRVLHDFGSAAGGYSAWSGLFQGSDGRLYGTSLFGGTGTWGTLFRVALNSVNGSGFEVLHNFTFSNQDGRLPYAPLIQASDGVFYGTTQSGGSFGIGGGTIFSLKVPLPPVITSPLTAAGVFNQAFNYTITATNSPTDFDALNLPSALSVNHATGLLSGLPQVTGVFPIDLAASNAAGTGLATLNLTISKATASLTLGNLAQTFDGAPKPVSVTTTPAGLAADVLYEGSATPPTNAGSYGVVATINSANYAGTTAGILNVAKASVSVAFDYLTRVYDGTARPAEVTTTPPGLPVTFTYDGGATPPTNVGSTTVVATIDSPNYLGTATATLSITPAPATITLGALTATYDGAPKPATATTSPAGLAVTFAYDGSATAPANAGSYAVVAVVENPNYFGSASGTLVIAKATATVALANLAQTYHGTPRTVTATTNPAGLNTTITYDGSATAPTNAGTYAVVATINDANYAGSAIGTLVVGKATAHVVLSNILQPFDGLPKAVAVATNPAGLSASVTYNSSPAAPSAKGAYSVAATVTDANYDGAALGTLTIHGAAYFAPLGDFPAGQSISLAHAVSDDGSVVIGESAGAIAPSEAFRWTNAGGMTAIPGLASGMVFSRAHRVSGDGAVVVGQHGGPNNKMDAFRWTQAGGTVSLGYLPNGAPQSVAYGISRDGSTIVGDGNGQAFLWTATGGMVGLGDLPGGATLSRGNAASADGSVIVGYGNGPSGVEAFRWTQATGMVGLGDLPHGAFFSVATDVSADGSVVVGQAHSADGKEAFRWTQAGGMVALGNLGVIGLRTANAVSGDGSIVVGFAASSSGTEAFIWTAATGMRSLRAVLVNEHGLGAEIGPRQLSNATGISSDGRFIVGYGSNPNGLLEAWLVALPPLAAPAITSTGSAAGTVGQSFSYTITADNSPASFAALNLPAGLSVNPSTGVISGTPTLAGTFVVTLEATNAGGTAGATLTLTIAKAAATATLGTLSSTYDGTPKPATATTSPAGLAVTFTYDGSPTAPTQAGSYAVVATIADANYTGSASGTLVIAKAPATVTLENTAQTYNGTPRAVSATTNPAGLNVTFAYDGSGAAPTNAGSYAVVATVTAPNHTGSASGTLTIAKATASVALTNTSQIFDGAPKPVTVTTNPSGLAVAVTYNGAANAPSAAGSYAVAATVTDPNYQGTADATLTIAAANVVTNVERTITLAPGQILAGGDSQGHPARLWSFGFPGGIPITPVTLNHGDTLRVTLTFANNEGLRVADDGSGAVQVNATSPGREPVLLSLLTGDSVIRSGDWSLSLVASGALLSPTMNVTSGLGTIGLFNNLVDSGQSFVVRGFTYEFRLNSGGPATINAIGAQIQAAQIAIIPLNYLEWAVAKGLPPSQNAPLADIEPDGLPNVLEYFFGFSPTISNQDVQPVGEVENGELAFRFRRDPSATGLTHRVAVSSDLVNWATSSVAPVLESTTGGIERYVVRLPLTAAKQFVRLEVTMAGTMTATAPFGHQRFALAGGTPTAPASTFFAVPFHRVEAPSAIRVGRIDAFTANTITSNSAVWNSSLVNPATPWFLRLRTGPAAGKTLPITGVAFATYTLTIGGADLTTLGLVAGQDSFEIIRGETLLSRFGTSSLLGGTSASTADNVLVRSGTTWLAYFYDTNLGFWRRTIGPATNSNHVKIAPDSGVEVLRRGPATTLTFVGQVSTMPFRSAVNNAGSSVLHTGYPTDTTLGALALQTLVAGWRSNPTEAGSDLLLLRNGVAWTGYFFNGSFWQNLSTGANSNAVPIPAGAVLMLQRPGTTSGTTDLVRPLPYSP